MKIGIVFGTFAPMHLGHLDVIEIAKSKMDKVYVICCGHEGDRGYPLLSLAKRFELAKKQFENDPQVEVALLPDTDPDIKKGWDMQQVWNYWTERMLLMLFKQGLITCKDELVFYTSEEDYTELLENTPEKFTVHKCSRVRPVSGTMIREDINGNAEKIAPAFRDYLIR